MARNDFEDPLRNNLKNQLPNWVYLGKNTGICTKNFYSNPTSEMTQSLLNFKGEYPVKKLYTFNASQGRHPFSNDIIAGGII